MSTLAEGHLVRQAGARFASSATPCEPACRPCATDSASTIHHRALNDDLVGISPDYEIRVAPRLLEDEDGPMVDLLEKAHATAIQVPKRKELKPDRELLAVRLGAFRSAA